MSDVGDDRGAEGKAVAAFDPDGVLVVTLTGEIDISNVDSLRDGIEPALAQRPERVVFDVAGLDFLDSSGIAMLLGAAARTSSVQLRNPSPIVRRIIEVTGLAGVLHVEP